MSSILKALKKLEKGVPKQNEVHFWLQKKHTKITAQKRVKNNLRFNKYFFIIFVAMVLSLGAGLIFSRKPWEKTPALVAKTVIKPIKPHSLPEKRAPIPDLYQKDTPIRKNAQKPEPDTKTAKTASPSARKPREKVPALVTKTKIKPAKPLSLPEKKALTPYTTQRETPTIKNVEKSEEKREAEQYASIPFKQAGESGLKLQAIAWSSDPKSRIAVINGRIVREGESVERALVTHIGKDDVIFKKGEEEWRQLFGLN